VFILNSGMRQRDHRSSAQDEKSTLFNNRTGNVFRMDDAETRKDVGEIEGLFTPTRVLKTSHRREALGPSHTLKAFTQLQILSMASPCFLV